MKLTKDELNDVSLVLGLRLSKLCREEGVDLGKDVFCETQPYGLSARTIGSGDNAFVMFPLLIDNLPKWFDLDSFTEQVYGAYKNSPT